MNEPGRAARLLLILCLLAACGLAHPATLRVASRGDALSMDPHALFESTQLGLLSNVYEPLVDRDAQLRLVPALALQWQALSPTVWRFRLRPGVRFHDGTPFGADDVVFSVLRAAGEASDLKGQLADLRAARQVDALTIDLETVRPSPRLPDALPVVLMMSRRWATDAGAVQPAPVRTQRESGATLQANGTGPFRLLRREPGVRTVLARHAGWWGTSRGNLDEVDFRPLASDATRVAALLSGEVDLIDPVPLQDTAQLRRAGFVVMSGPELRVLFIGMDQRPGPLRYADVRDRNPLREHRVRQALYQAIDIEALRIGVMQGAAVPTALIVGRGVHGYRADLDQRLPFDPAASRRLLAEAGYAGGFGITLHCPNDRYVNDARLCQAIAAQWARAGLRITLVAETKLLWLPRLQRRDTSLYLFGWTPATLDAQHALKHLVESDAPYNIGGFSDPEIDRLLAAIDTAGDAETRDALIARALRRHRDAIGHLPLYQQTLAWGANRRVRIDQPATGVMRFTDARLEPARPR